MRSKLVLAALFFLTLLPVYAQVAPAARISGLPLGVGVGIVDYDTDYYKPDLPYWSGRMIGVSAWADYSIYHGFGVAVEGQDIMANKPTPRGPFGETTYGSLQEKTLQGGFIYRHRQIYHVRPFLQAMGGMGKIDFPTTSPLYTSETSPLYSFGGGLEYRVWSNLFLRGQYEYQIWKGFRSGSQSLNPSGATVGVTYYLRGPHHRY